MSLYLADGNLLIALTVLDHVHHDIAIEWFDGTGPDLATCPITEGTLLRFLIREGQGSLAAMAVLDELRAQPWHRFWPDAIRLEASHLRGVIGHRQVTDAYLVALASHHGERVASFDRGLATLHPEAVELLPA